MLECSNELVKKLSSGTHEISFEDRVLDKLEVKKRLSDGFVFVKFLQTRGGTELGINLIADESDLSMANFESETGLLHLVGTCELNYYNVKCIADIDLKTRKGNGYLRII